MSFDSTFWPPWPQPVPIEFCSNLAAAISSPARTKPAALPKSRRSCNRFCIEGVLAVGRQCSVVSSPMARLGVPATSLRRVPASEKHLQTSPQEAACRRFDEEAKRAKASWECGGISASTTRIEKATPRASKHSLHSGGRAMSAALTVPVQRSKSERWEKSAGLPKLAASTESAV